MLPPSVAVVDAVEVEPGFHARFSARGKHYRYRVLARRDRSPLLSRHAWHRPGDLDLAAMGQAARDLVGEHDFSAFRATGCAARHPVRRITRIDLDPRAGGELDLHVHGNAFLRNMVRIVAGTLVEVGAGRRPPDLAAVLASRDRTLAGITAPAEGLTLVQVFYGDRLL
jgi:tRNA pseudouridine38-40 synthase